MLYFHLFAVVLALLIGPFVAGLLWIWQRLRLPAHPEFQVLEWEDPLIPADFVHFVEVGQQQLYTAGFNIAAAAYTPTWGRAVSFLAVFENPLQREIAILTTRYRVTFAGLLKAVCQHTTFVTEYADGQVITTDNAPTVYGDGVDNRLIRNRFPHFMDMLRLYRLHRALTIQTRGNAPRCVLTDFDAVQYLADLATRRAYNNLAAGAWAHDEDTDTIVPTFATAIHLAFEEFFPGPLVRAIRSRRLAGRLLTSRPEALPGNPTAHPI